jgi:ADP-heptose:LPS heptosyltransferase
LSGLGDVVHGLPVVNAIKDRYPDSHVTWVVEPMPAGILAGHPSIDRVVVFDRKRGFAGLQRLRDDLRKGPRADITLNFNVYFKSIWPMLIAHSRRRVGFDRKRSFDGVSLASNEHLPDRPWVHTADMFLEFADYLGAAPASPEWRIEFSDDERDAQAAFFSRFSGQPVATVIPASASTKKDWAPDRWAKVVDALASQFGFKVIIAGGPGEREQGIARQIVENARAPVDWAMGDSVRRLAWIIAGSSLVIAPDTGPVHIARALEVPVVGIYGHTNPWRVGPWHAYSDLWVDHYTEPGTPPDPSNRTPRWHVMPGIQSAEVIDRIGVAVAKYGAAQIRNLAL